ncbi:NAD(P) oxidoreductase, FAD-containingsubunit [Candidatus Scalindua japonica]|uniref:NAD(P) oxidoreductase, FAD-containingsubunit n=1 Tax=Candidatus Scalindua japonica TaxID=1284222 RepID=A0A286U1K8_9BACT|nr:FAD-dependent oxidoreductase [Candidatus Scalindua japonica]GAX62014.1 NAD(P) oxidoreductase, FAD-containingsubunit [Candidatus Scalindua japonica]
MSQTEDSGQGTRVSLELDWLKENIRCQHRCPAHMDIPGYIRLISQGKYEDSYKLMLETNPFPTVCGYVCPRPCESKCKRGDFDKPVSIDNLKRFVTDYIYKNRIKVPAPRIEKRAEKIAVIGAGPAGLTAANDLAGMGYQVTVFEKESRVGGMMMWAIPSYRLPREQIMFDVSNIEARGVEIKLNTHFASPDMTISGLLEGGYKAVFIAVGAQRGRKLEVSGEEGTEGVMDCLDFLKDVSAGDLKSPGKTVAVIGGGNSAVDAARTAKRITPDVHIVYRRTRNEMPALKHEIEEAELEGISFHYLVAPVKVLVENGKAKGLECVKMELGEPDSSGRRRPQPIPDSEFVIDTDCIITALSQEADLEFLGDDSGLEATKWGTLVVDDGLKTGIEGVFAGGDVAMGPSTIIECIAQGHLASKSIDCYIRGEGFEETKDKAWVTLIEGDYIQERESNFDSTPREEMATIPKSRRGSFDLVELGFMESQARLEADRCLKCDLSINVVADDCILCGRCSSVCPVDALEQVDADTGGDHKPHVSKDGVVIRHTDMCIRCGNCKDCPVDAINMKRVFWEPNEEINKSHKAQVVSSD